MKIQKVINNTYSWTATVLLLICSAFYFPSAMSVPCNNFPKIFGGSSGNTKLYSLDVFEDYLAFGGYVADSTLTGTTSNIPYIAIASISRSDYYIAKALKQLIGE